MVSTNLYLANSPAAVGLIPGIIAKGVKVMLFAGDEDLICNYKGIERIVENMDWDGAQGMEVS
jgi:carboxypeptidase D